MPAHFESQPVDERADQRRRRIKLAGGLFLAAVVLGAGLGARWYFTPPPMPTTLDEARALVNSPRFDRLHKAQKQPYYDVIREQYGSLNRAERRRLREENEKLAEAMREARTVQMRQWVAAYARKSPEEREALIATFRRGRPDGRRGGGNGADASSAAGGGPGADAGRGGPRAQGGEDGPPQRPERSEEEKAERAERAREHVSDRMANGDSQLNQLMREMFSQRRQNRR
ncbi:MAG: hypothetical protein AAGG38_07520 [Planctomycetota bacterium]